MFRFSIRDALWLTAFAAAVIAWRVDRRKLIADLDPNVHFRGVIVQVDEEPGQADVSLGSDDAIVSGDRFEVFRGNAKVGEVTISEVEPDRSRGPVSAHSKIRTGDKAVLTIRRSEYESVHRRFPWHLQPRVR